MQVILNTGCPAEDNWGVFDNADSREGQVWNTSCYTFVAWCSILSQVRMPVEKGKQLSPGTFGPCLHTPRDLGFGLVLTGSGIQSSQFSPISYILSHC